MSLQLGIVFINHEGGVSPQMDIGKPDVGVNMRLGTVFINHEEHEGHEENTKGKDIAPLGLIGVSPQIAFGKPNAIAECKTAGIFY